MSEQSTVMQRILVTGGQGFIGRPLCDHLHQQGFDVISVSRHGANSALLSYECHAIGCISQFDGWARLLNHVDAVVHLAALTHASDAASPPEAQYMAVNVRGTERLLEAAIEAGVKRFIYMSSIKVNGNSTAPGKPFTAGSAPAPQDAYGRSKYAAETLVSTFCERSGMASVILRPPLVVGPGVKGNLQRLMSWIESGLWLPLGAINNRRSMLSIDTLVGTVQRVLLKPELDGDPLLISDQPALSTAELARQLAFFMNRPSRLIAMPPVLLRWAGAALGRGDVVARLCDSLEVDASATWQYLDWEPNNGLEDALSQMARSRSG